RGMDANEYALKVQPAAKSLGLAIRKAMWMGKGPAPARDEALVVEIATPPTAPAAPIEASAELPTPAVPAIDPSPALVPAPAVSPAPAPVPPAAPPASPVPPAPTMPPIERSGPDVRITLGDRLYRIR